jgi:hypothetical protein
MANNETLSDEELVNLSKIAVRCEEGAQQREQVYLETLTNYTPEQWHPWIEDQLSYRIANPMFPGFDSTRWDDIVELFTHFKIRKLSAAQYQTALMEVLQSLAFELKKNSGNETLSAKCVRLANALMGSEEPVQNKKMLLKMFFDPNNDSIIIEDRNILLKGYLLQCLSRAPITDSELEMVQNTSFAYVLGNAFDPIYLSGVLRVAWRKYSVEKFFEVYLLIAKSITERNLLDNRMIVNMVDVIHSVGFYKNKEFVPLFDGFMEKLNSLEGITPMLEYIKKDEALTDYRNGKID